MRGVLLFPRSPLGEVRTALKRIAIEQAPNDWVISPGAGERTSPSLYLYISDATGELAGWEPAMVAELTQVLGHQPTWYVSCDVSSHTQGTTELNAVVAALLEDGGVAVDDSDHLWTADDIATNRTIDGRPFGS